MKYMRRNTSGKHVEVKGMAIKCCRMMKVKTSDVQGLGKPPGFKGKGQEGKGQGRDFMTLRKPLPLAGVRGFGG